MPHRKINCGIQIIHDRGNHWIVASTINSEKLVLIYDSVFSTVNNETAEVIKNLFEIRDKMRIDISKMQRQIGSQDCGIFAIAVSTVILNGLDVSQITFSQKEMRGHLMSCFEAESITPFPYMIHSNIL